MAQDNLAQQMNQKDLEILNKARDRIKLAATETPKLGLKTPPNNVRLGEPNIDDVQSDRIFVQCVYNDKNTAEAAAQELFNDKEKPIKAGDRPVNVSSYIRKQFKTEDEFNVYKNSVFFRIHYKKFVEVFAPEVTYSASVSQNSSATTIAASLQQAPATVNDPTTATPPSTPAPRKIVTNLHAAIANINLDPTAAPPAKLVANSMSSVTNQNPPGQTAVQPDPNASNTTATSVRRNSH